MQVIVLRNVQGFTKNSSQGRMLVDDVFECYTMEPVWIPMPTWVKPRAIGEGTFPLRIRWSVKHNRMLPHVEDVPNFDAIEIHIGNDPKDTDGCTMVGESLGIDFIGLSFVAFTKLFAKLLAGATLTNPDAPEQDHVWDVGAIIYKNVARATRARGI